MTTNPQTEQTSDSGTYFGGSGMSYSTNTPIDTPEQSLLEYTKSLMNGLDQVHFPRDEQTKIFNTALAALDRYYHSQTEKVLREVIGGDQHDVKDAGGNLYMSSNIRSNNAMRAEQRQRAANLGYQLKEEKV